MSKRKANLASQPSTKKIGQEFLYKLRYKNDLPDVPFDPKLLKYPHAQDRHYKYFESSLERCQMAEMIHPDGDQGLGSNPFKLGFLEREFRKTGEEKIDAMDERDVPLMASPPEEVSDPKIDLKVPWLHNTEYISQERSTFNRNRLSTAPKYSLINVRFETETQSFDFVDLSLDMQIRKVEDSFEAVKYTADLSALRHPKKAHLRANEVFHLYPDFEYWPNQYSLATFDSNPHEMTSTVTVY